MGPHFDAFKRCFYHINSSTLIYLLFTLLLLYGDMNECITKMILSLTVLKLLKYILKSANTRGFTLSSLVTQRRSQNELTSSILCHIKGMPSHTMSFICEGIVQYYPTGTLNDVLLLSNFLQLLMTVDWKDLL